MLLPVARRVSRDQVVRFMVQVAANLVPIQYDDPRARVRLMLYRSDGKSSWGGSCPLRPRDP